jgi:hypothetical protein
MSNVTATEAAAAAPQPIAAETAPRLIRMAMIAWGIGTLAGHGPHRDQHAAAYGLAAGLVSAGSPVAAAV